MLDNYFVIKKKHDKLVTDLGVAEVSVSLSVAHGLQ